MGRQWLHAKRLVAGAKKAKTNTKLVRDIALAAKSGGADPAMNARLFTAIEAGAEDVQPLTREQNDDIPADVVGARFICERTDVATVSKWLSANGWTVVTSEIGYVPKVFSELTEAQQEEVGEFLHALDENDDVHRVWAALK